jgi:hypothetical protein
MIVRVEDPTKKAQADVIDPNSFEKMDYLKQKQIIREMAGKDPKKAWDYLKKAFLVNGEVIRDGHELAHIIGNEAYNKYGFEGIKICDYKFANGCQHGVAEKMLLNGGKNVLQEMEADCLKIWPPDKSSDFAACYHGAGHGLIGWRGLDLKKALGDCDSFRKQFADMCYDGVFMEYTNSAPDSYFNQKDPWAICNTLSINYQPKCAKYQVNIVKQKFKSGFPGTIKICENAPNFSLQTNCLLGMSQFLTSESKGEHDKIKKVCDSITIAGATEQCMVNAAQSVTEQQFDNWEKVSVELCASLSSSEKQNTCIKTANKAKRI